LKWKNKKRKEEEEKRGTTERWPIALAIGVIATLWNPGHQILAAQAMIAKQAMAWLPPEHCSLEKNFTFFFCNTSSLFELKAVKRARGCLPKSTILRS